MGGDVLPVEDHRVLDGVVADGLQHEVGLLLGLGHRGRLGEEVDPYVQTGVQRPLDIRLEALIHLQGPLGVAPVANPDHGEVDAGIGHGLPVDLPLVDGDIDALGGLLAVLLIVDPALAVRGEGGGVIGVFVQSLQHEEHLIPVGEVFRLRLF